MIERITMKRKFRLLSGILVLVIALCTIFLPVGVSAATKNKDKETTDTVPAAEEPEPYIPEYVDQNTSTPRVIVTGFSTKPKKVMAGSNFKLVIHLQNTSKKTRVSNMLFTLSAPEGGEDAEASSPVFLPTSGSNSIYLDGIKANGTADITIKLTAKSDLMQKPYSVNLSMVYEDSKSNQYEASSSLSIPVRQEVRFEIGDFEVSPPTVEPGNDVNVMCSVYNTGRVKLYNVKASFEGAAVAAESSEVFLGNIGPGANAAIDTMLATKDAEAGTAKVTMTLTYEDETGKVSDTTKDLELEVMAKEDEKVAQNVPENVPQQSPPIMLIVIVVVIIIAVIITIVLIVRRKKKKALNAEEALFDEVD
jgi:flagellar basal body-associated protein FliL